MDPDANELGSFYYSNDSYFLVFFNWWRGFLGTIFPQSGGTKIIRCKAVLSVIN